jgi:hypothetical protein
MDDSGWPDWLVRLWKRTMRLVWIDVFPYVTCVSSPLNDEKLEILVALPF